MPAFAGWHAVAAGISRRELIEADDALQRASKLVVAALARSGTVSNVNFSLTY